jgi:hypothetical protein
MPQALADKMSISASQMHAGGVHSFSETVEKGLKLVDFSTSNKFLPKVN